jgi:hypothetical protein
MSHEFTLVIANDNIADEQVNALYEAGLDEGTVSTSRGVTRIDVAREADSLESAIRSAIGQVNLAGLTVATVEIEADRLATQPVH